MTDTSALAERLRLIAGCVNLRPFRGKAPGTLLVGQVLIIGEAMPVVRVRLIHDPAGWNNRPATNGKEYVVVDSKGESLFPPAVFPDGWEYEIVEFEDRP